MISFLSYLLSTKAKETSAGLATSEDFVLLAVLPLPLCRSRTRALPAGAAVAGTGAGAQLGREGSESATLNAI